MSFRKVIAAGAILSGIGMLQDDLIDQAFAYEPQSLDGDEPPSSYQRQREVPFQVLSFHQNVVKSNYTTTVSEIKESTIKYRVRKGDTLSHIAQRFDISVKELTDFNQIDNPHQLSIDQELKIPVKTEVYKVEEGDTLEKIANKKGLTLEEIVEANRDFVKRFPITEQDLVIPKGKPEPLLYTSKSKKTVSVSTLSTNKISVEEKAENGLSLPVFSWPVKDVELTSRFGMRWGRHHNGIDMVSASGDLNIYAAKTGKVVLVERSRVSLGNLVVMDHGNGVETYYAHLSKILVKEGEVVRAGKVLGKMGNTGNSTGTHLHFEVRKNNEPINPLKVLLKEI